MKYIIFFFFLFCTSCIYHEVMNFSENCSQDLAYGGHYLRIPITIAPHQLTYQVGDTIGISTIFSDSIYDLGTQTTFKIEGFPFIPLSLLYRFKDGNTHDSGYRVNEYYIDSSYNHVYNYSNTYADAIKGYTIYENEEYHYKFQLILRETGTYIFLMNDVYQNHNGSGNSNLNAEADAITFEGKCDNLSYYLCSMIDSGDDHLDHFMNKLVYLDKEVYRGKLGSIAVALDPLKTGSIAVEFSGFFGFEVVE
ncbi:MAG: hypothetical protein AB8G15_22050 [Saprospiraceae bacterium]